MEDGREAIQPLVRTPRVCPSLFGPRSTTPKAAQNQGRDTDPLTSRTTRSGLEARIRSLRWTVSGFIASPLGPAPSASLSSDVCFGRRHRAGVYHRTQAVSTAPAASRRPESVREHTQVHGEQPAGILGGLIRLPARLSAASKSGRCNPCRRCTHSNSEHSGCLVRRDSAAALNLGLRYDLFMPVSRPNGLILEPVTNGRPIGTVLRSQRHLYFYRSTAMATGSSALTVTTLVGTQLCLVSSL